MNSGNTAQSLQQNQPTSRLFFPPRDNLGVHSPERLGDVAVPADGLVAGENLGKLLGRELVPPDRLPIRSHQGRGIHMTESSETHVAKSTALSFIPIGHDVPDQAVVGIGLDLVEALLTAVSALRPARALPQTRLRLTDTTRRWRPFLPPHRRLPAGASPGKLRYVCRDTGSKCARPERCGKEQLRPVRPVPHYAKRLMIIIDTPVQNLPES